MQSSHRDCPKTPPPPYFSLSQVDCLDPTLIFIDLRTLFTVSFFSSQSRSISVQKITSYKWGMFSVIEREDFWHEISYSFKIILFINLVSNIYLIKQISLFEYFLKFVPQYVKTFLLIFVSHTNVTFTYTQQCIYIYTSSLPFRIL